MYYSYPKHYNDLREKWDTTGEYHRRFEEYLHDKQFNVITIDKGIFEFTFYFFLFITCLNVEKHLLKQMYVYTIHKIDPVAPPYKHVQRIPASNNNRDSIGRPKLPITVRPLVTNPPSQVVRTNSPISLTRITSATEVTR